MIFGRSSAATGRLTFTARTSTPWRQAVAAGNDSPKLLASIGGYYFNQGDYAQSAALLKRVVDTDPKGDEQYLRFLIVSLIRSDDRAGARGYLRQYLELHGLNEKTKQLIRTWSAGKKS